MKKNISFEAWLEQNQIFYYPDADDNEKDRLKELYNEDIEKS